MSEQATTTEAIYEEYNHRHIEPIHRREEIVRCRECEHFRRNAVDGTCNRLRYFTYWAEPDGFCAWGKRAGER